MTHKAIEVLIPLTTMQDKTKEAARLMRQITKLNKSIDSTRRQLTGGFADKAPDSIVAEVRQSLAEKEAQLDILEKSFAALDE
jgi:valyl-tRNA synthetase